MSNFLCSIASRNLALSTVAALTLAGCFPDPELRDGFTTEPFTSADEDRAGVHSPYVAGAHVQFTVDGDGDGWVFESDREDVLTIDAQDGFTASCTAVGPGEAVVTAYPATGRGDAQLTAEISVRVPTGYELVSQGAVDAFSVFVAEDEPAVLTGGRATFAIHYLDGSTRLSGGLELDVDDVALATQRIDDLTVVEDRIALTPSTTGEHVVRLRGPGGELPDLRFVAIDAAAVDGMELYAPEEGELDDDQEVAAFAHVTANGRRVYGAPLRWSLDGATVKDDDSWLEAPSEGTDILRYSYAEGEAHRLGVSFDGTASELEVHGYGFSASDSNDYDLSCAARPGGPGAGASVAAWGLAVLGGLFARRRRPRLVASRVQR